MARRSSMAQYPFAAWGAHTPAAAPAKYSWHGVSPFRGGRNEPPSCPRLLASIPGGELIRAYARLSSSERQAGRDASAARPHRLIRAD